MIAPLSELRGLGSIPLHKSSSIRWCQRNSVTLSKLKVKGGEAYFVDTDTLPDIECRAAQESVFRKVNLAPGTYDDAAHKAFERLSKGVRAKAEMRAMVARFIAIRPGGEPWPETVRAVHAEFGTKSSSEASLRRMMASLEGIDPINWPPALAPKHKGRTAKAETSDEAWRWFLSLLSEAAPEWPIKSAWERVKRDAKAKGWTWPSYATINRRWLALSKRERMIVRFGADEADKRLYQPIRRDPTSIRSLEIVSLDGRTLDIVADFGDGVARRPTMLALTDCASGKLLDFILSPSEKADCTRDLIVNTCETYGPFDKLYPDNGAAFAAHVISGRVVHKFRNGKNRNLVLERPGVCDQLGIEITFALPGNPKAKIAERKFRDFSRQIDDAPEFAGAHVGHKPGDSPNAKPVPVPIETVEAIYKREIALYNAEPKRRSAACRGKLSYEQAFEAGLSGRTPRVLTARQIKLARLDYKAVTVDARGQFKVRDWVYGDLKSQDALLRYEGHKIFVGYEGADMAAPVVAYDAEDERLICENIKAVEFGKYDSEAGAKLAAKQMADARKANRKAEEALRLVKSADVAARLGVRPAQATPDQTPATVPSKVVKGAFNAPIKPGTAKATEPEECAISPEEWGEMADKILANKPARKANARG